MAQAQRLKILLVEDDEVPREISAKALRLCVDAEVISTDTGEEAIKLFQEHHPALIIQDLRLNGAMTGWDCIKEYRKYDLKAKVIVTSANAIAEGANVELIKNYAISETLRKPFSIQQFQEIVKQVLADNYTYKDYLINKNEVISIQVSPTAEKLIHTIDSLLWNMKLKFEKYTLDYTVEELFCDQMTHENFKKQKEVFQKAINLLKISTKEVDDIVEQVEKIKFFKEPYNSNELPQKVESKPTSQGIGKVLIVEDDDAAREYSAKYIRERGIDVFSAINGKEALEIVEHEKNLDLILLDIQMPVMNGIEFLKEMRKRDISIKVVIISAYDSDEFKKEAYKWGAIDYKHKPLKREDLWKIVTDNIKNQEEVKQKP